jgi:hypothetical protein
MRTHVCRRQAKSLASIERLQRVLTWWRSVGVPVPRPTATAGLFSTREQAWQATDRLFASLPRGYRVSMVADDPAAAWAAPGLHRSHLIAVQAAVLGGLITGAASGYFLPHRPAPAPAQVLDGPEAAGFLAGIGSVCALLLGTGISWFGLDRAATKYRAGIWRGEVLVVVVGPDPRRIEWAEMVLVLCGARYVRTGLAEFAELGSGATRGRAGWPGASTP